MLIEAQQKQNCTLVEPVCNFSWMRGATNICSPRVRLLRELMCASSTSASMLSECAGKSLGISEIGFSLLALLWTSVFHKAFWLSFRSQSLISGIGIVTDDSAMLVLRTTLTLPAGCTISLFGEGRLRLRVNTKTWHWLCTDLPGDIQKAFFSS